MTSSPLHFQYTLLAKSPSPLCSFSTRRFAICPIRSSLTSNKTPSSGSASGIEKLPMREIPGDYGLPIIGPIKDRQDYFYNQGKDLFFKSRVEKYKSTVFRVNMPPGPSISKDSKVIVLLDAKSFPVLFDMSKVEKKDLFTGTFMPSTDLTGGYRMLAYIDPAEPSHAKLKTLLFFLLKSCRDRILPEFHTSFTEMFESLESSIAAEGKAVLGDANDKASWTFLGRAFFGVDVNKTKLGSDGPKIIQKWIVFHLAPILSIGLPKLVEEPLIHTFSLPPALIKGDYKRLYDYFFEYSTPILDEAVNLGISREEACNNILFATCFNTFGGMKILFPNMFKWVGKAGPKLHAQLAEEIRTAIKNNGGKITMSILEKIPLTKSIVYESLRIEPPVASQYGRAKTDFVLSSHDSSFKVKKGEMLFGFQPFATKDPKIFDRPEEFVPDRFVGEEGEKLLKYLLWSNGPETESPSLENKQCAGKDFVVMVARLLLVEFFVRYDSLQIEIGTSVLGAAVTVKSLTRATS